MDIVEKVKEFVDRSFGKKKPHFERTVYWIEKFIPNATEAHKIAAYSHDVERAFRDADKMIPEDYIEEKFLKNHQEKGSEIMADFLRDEGALEYLIKKVKHLIESHEFGGDEEQNALMDADSISFFETNAEHFVNERSINEGYDKIKSKLDWNFNRISSKKHKDIIRDNYKKWLDVLEEYKD